MGKSRNQKKKDRRVRKTIRKIEQKAKNNPLRWWRVNLKERHRFPGTWLPRGMVYVRARTIHGLTSKVQEFGGIADAETATPVGSHASFWECDVPLTAYFAVRIE
jgi:hypothetical protein